MPAISLIQAVKKAPVGTPGSSAVERGFDVQVETKPNLAAYRVAVIWTENAWQTVHYSECELTDSQDGREIWSASISFYSSAQVSFFYALAAAGPDGINWANNRGWNYMI